MPPPTITKAQPSSNGIYLEWTVSDSPSYIQIHVDASVVPNNLPPSQKSFTVTNIAGRPLQPGATYSCAVCSGYANEGLECSSPRSVTWPGQPPATTIQITGIQPYPRHLQSQGSGWIVTDNGITISWTASGEIAGLNVELDSTSGNFIKGLNIGGAQASGASGTISDFPVPTPGATYLVKVRGGLQSGGTTAFSPATTFTAATNFHSLRDFLKYSGVSGSGGIRHFFPANTEIKLRGVLGV